MLPDMPPLICPRCGMMDHVQKVSALVTAGASTSYGSSAGYMTGYAGRGYGVVTAYGQMYQAGSQQTLLSERLAPPSAPQLGPAWTADDTVAVLILGFIALCLFLLLLLDAAITNDQSVAVYGALLALPFVAGAGVLVKRAATRHKSKRAEWKEEYAEWQAMMAKWEELYFCWRDDAVFIPGNSPAIPVSDMWDFLWNAE
jgi:hypothetical protein